jgi:SSS family solute:Na+ symporter
MSGIDYVIVVAYLVGVFAVGFLCSRGNLSLRDFFLGDRNIPWWAAACSGVGAIVSGVAFLGAPGLAFSRDFSYHQMRLGIPIALLVICGVMLPIFFG